MKKKNYIIDKYLLIDFTNCNKEQLDIIYNMRNHQAIRKWMINSKIIPKNDHLRFVKNLSNDKKNCYWLVQRKFSGDYIGVISLNKIDKQNKNSSLGIYKNPELSEPGLGKVLLNCLFKINFDIFKLHTLKLEVLTDNIPAIKLYKKSGFKEEGLLREVILRGNKWQNMLLMGCFKQEIKLRK